MEYKDLERQIQDLNIAYKRRLKISKDNHSIEIYDDIRCYVSIASNTSHCMQVCQESFSSLEENLRYHLLKAVYKFAQTPVDSRHLYPKFYLSSKLTPDDDCRFLFKIGRHIDSLGWGYKNGGDTEFTQEEIDYICDKFHTNLSDFVIEEVGE